MEQPKPFSREESLELIESMINNARNHFSENGHLYLLWGWVVFLCSIIQFILFKVFHSPYYYMIWMATWVVAIYQVVYLVRKRRQQRVKTYSHHIIGFVWLAFIITMFIMAFIIARGINEGAHRLVNPVFLTMYGVPTFLTGIILRFKPLVLGGICCWLLSILSTFIPLDYQILLISAAMLVAWIIPGYQLNAKFKKQFS